MFNYSQLDISSSIQESYNLVCDNEIYLKLHASFYFVGLAIGSIFGGHLGDRIGRVKVMRISNFAIAVLLSFMAITNSFLIHSVLYVIVSSFLVTSWIAMYTYSTEIGSIKLRAKVAAGLAAALGSGYIVSALISLMLPNWRHFLLAISGIVFISFVLSLIMDESPKWLWSQKRHREVYKILKRAEKIETFCKHEKSDKKQECKLFSLVSTEKRTKESFLEKWIFDFKNVFYLQNEKDDGDNSDNFAETSAATESIFGVFKYPRIVFRISLLSIYFSSVMLIYFGLLYGAQLFGQKIHLFTIFQGSGAVIGAVLSFFLLNMFGRKLVSIFCLLCVSICFCICIVTPDKLKIITLASTLLARVCIEILGFLIFLWPSEMMPTTIRTSVLGLLSFVCRVVNMILPFIESLSAYWESLPLLFFGVLSFATLFPVFFLPETKNKQLPSNLKEGNDFGVIRNETGETIDTEEKEPADDIL